MHTRTSWSARSASCFLLLVLLAPAGWPITPKSELYVVNVKPPSVAVLATDSMKIAAEVPLDGEPSFALTDPANRFLYVLEDGVCRTNGMLKPGFGKLAVVDLASRKLVKTVPLAWNTKNVALSKNGRYLVCVSEGKYRTRRNSPEELGSITVIDTTNNEAVATLTVGRPGGQVVYNGDLSRLAVLTPGQPPQKKGEPGAKPTVTIFSLAQEKPLAEIEVDRAEEIALSPDERWLYVLDRGVASRKPAQQKSGAVHIIDLSEAKLVRAQEVATLPKGLSVDPESGTLNVLAWNSLKERDGRLFRFRGADLEQTTELGRDPQFIRSFGNNSGSYVATFEDLRRVPASGPAASSFVALNPRKGAGAPAAEGKTLGGNVPGETLYLPRQNKLVAVLMNRLGAPTSKVAIIDLQKNSVEHVITTGRGSVKFGKFMGAMALSVAMSGLSYYANYSVASSMGSPYFFYNVYVFTPAPPNLELASSTDGEHVYALNTSTNDITIIKVGDGSVVDRIAVGGGCKRVALAPGGRFVYSYTSGQFDLIDTANNKKHLEHKLESGRINALYALEGDKRLVTLTSDSVLFWDAEKGAQTGKIGGLHQPWLLVEPKWH